ncbi:hypothetical protein RDI58_026788 [Solanum bulbocastanum]|uniref:Uncharacterized protein n=1 Tax=Solanum bulbocastanum TaxID=147425 RepID=A0AAN8SZQ2_SOLBU
MCYCLQNGIVLDVYVHMPEEESGASFSKVGTIEIRASENIEYNESDNSENNDQLENDQYGSDVHEELIQLRAEKRSFLKRRKRRVRISADTE